MKYSNLVIAIPHSSGHPHEAIGASWGDDPEVVRERDRWTDWFTDELFHSEIGDVDVVKCCGSRFGERPAVKRQKGTTDGSPGVAHHFASGLRVLAPPLPEDASATSRLFRPSAMPRPGLTRDYESRMFGDSAASRKPIAQRCRRAFWSNHSQSTASNRAEP